MTRETGWSSVELVASVSLLVVGLMSLAIGFHGTARLASTSRQNYLLSLTCRNMIAELEGSSFSTLTSEYGPSSGKSAFWSGDNDADGKAEAELFYSAPTTSLASGSVQFFNNESSMPSTWCTLTSGLDLDADGIVGLTADTDYKILPTRITISVNGTDGTRTLTTDLILVNRGL